MRLHQLTNHKSLHLVSDFAVAWSVLSVMIYCCGCSEEMKGGPRMDVIPVTGKVLINGEPRKGVVVDFIRVGVPGVEFAVPEPQGLTDENGVMTLSTYVSGDGGAPGEYKLIFELGNRTNPITGEVTGDAFKGRFRDPRKSEVTVNIPDSVSDGEGPYDLGTIELSTE